MFKTMLATLLILTTIATPEVLASKIQQQAIVTAADCTARGIANGSCLPLTDQIYDSTNGQQLSASISGGQLGGGGGSSGKNYLSVYKASTSGGTANTGNGDFELGTTAGWSLAHSALSGVTPTSVAAAGTAFDATHGGSSASGNLSVSASTSSPLQKSNSGLLTSSAASVAGDMLISSAFFIDSVDEAKMMTVTFDYSVVSGTLNFSGTSSNSFAIYIYDVTNGAWIMPAGVYGMIQSSGNAYVKNVTFQTTTNSTKYQLALININATGGSYSLKLDEFSVGPQVQVQGPAMTDMVNIGVMSIGAVTTAPTKGTTSLDQVETSRIGDKLHLQIQYHQTGAGTAGSGVYLIALPSGLVADTTKVTASTSSSDIALGNLGQAVITDGGYKFHGQVTLYDSTHLAVHGIETNGTTTAKDWWQATSVVTLANSALEFSLNALIPIAGWSSNSSMSNDTDTRVVTALAYGNPGSVSNLNPVIFPSVSYDTHAAYNASTGQYKVPVTGYYDVAAAFPPSASGGYYVAIYKNGVATPSVLGYASGSLDFAGASQVFANANDLIDIRPVGANLSSFGSNNSMMISRRSGPAVVSASEKVYLKYTGNAGTALTASVTNMDFSTKVVDSHGAWNGTTFTAPRTGWCEFKGNVFFTSGNTGQPQLYINGSAKEAMSPDVSDDRRNFVGAAFMNGGDTATIRYTASATELNSAVQHWIAISCL